MIVLDSKKICFVCTPKNGTHTLYGHLGRHGGRRIGGYHEHNRKLIPRSLLGRRYKTFLVWREPEERAVSLFKDIVIRENEDQRVVKDSRSIKRAELITRLCPTFDKFIDLITYCDLFSSDFLFKNQTWWYRQVRPSEIVKLSDLDDLLREITGEVPERLHTSRRLASAIEVNTRCRRTIREDWARDDFELIDH